MQTAVNPETPVFENAVSGIPLGQRAIINITALRKSYGSNEVLKGIDLQVRQGEVIAIIGKSGSGKSTLLRCINGLEIFQEGALSVDGKPLLHESAMAMRELRQRVGMIFQSFNLFPHLTVGKNIMLAPSLVKKKTSSESMEQARRLLERVGLAEKFDAMPEQLSGGQQQRVAIARALAMEPVGHIAGIAAAITGLVSTLMSVPISIYIGRYIKDTALPLFIGFAICAACSLIVLSFLKYYKPEAKLR